MSLKMRERSLSSKLRLYGKVYSEYMKNAKESVRVTSSAKTKKSLTDYQKFVKAEAVKEKYAGLRPEERLVKIARAWKKQLKKSEGTANVQSPDRRRTRKDPDQSLRGHSKACDSPDRKKRKEVRKGPESSSPEKTKEACRKERVRKV